MNWKTGNQRGRQKAEMERMVAGMDFLAAFIGYLIKFIILAGEKYRKFIIPHLCNSNVPLEGLRQGEQNQFFNRNFRGQHI